MSPAQARLVSRRDLGNAPLIRELTRETWGRGAAERLLQDARSAIRALRRNPGYACAVVLTLALGIGLNASMYTLLSRLVLQAPPYIEAPDEVHRVWMRERFRCDENGDPTAPLFTREGTDWADFSALGAGRWAVGRLLVIESLVLATVSGGAAPALAAVASRVLRSTLLPEHQWAAGPLDVTAIAFTGVAAVAIGLATAVAPAVYAARSRGIDRLDGLRGARLRLSVKLNGDSGEREHGFR